MYQPMKGFSLLLALLGSCHALLLPRALSNPTPQNTTAVPAASTANTSKQTTGYTPDHPEWDYLNHVEWWKTDATQQDHLRFHAELSMAAYGDYESTCPSTFQKGFTVLQKFDSIIGPTGFVALIPEMEKVVIVFVTHDNLDLVDWTPTSISDLVPDCEDCQAAQGVKSIYLSARENTNNWAVAKAKVAETGLKFSVTGHGIAGSVAALAALDLGSKGFVHYAHTQGMSRTFNYPAVVKYDNYFQVLAGQNLIAENDFMVQAIPLGTFAHIGTRVKILGDKQQYLVNCYGNNEDPKCNGDGSNHTIHNFYFTPKGSCGSVKKPWE